MGPGAAGEGGEAEACCRANQQDRNHLQAFPRRSGEEAVWLVLGLPKRWQGLQVQTCLTSRVSNAWLLLPLTCVTEVNAVTQAAKTKSSTQGLAPPLRLQGL